MAHVEEQLHVSRCAEFVAKAQHLNPKRRSIVRWPESIQQEFPQRMDRVIGRIEYFVRERAYPFHRGALGPDSILQPFAALGRMRPPRFAEPPREDLVRRFEE